MKNGPFFLNNLIIYSSNFAMYIGWKVMRKYVCIKCSKIQKKSSKWGFVQSADFLPYRLPCSNTKFCTFYSLQSTATTGIPIHTTEKPPYLRPQDTRDKMFSSFWLGKQYSCAARGAEERFPIIRLDGARRHCLLDSPRSSHGRPKLHRRLCFTTICQNLQTFRQHLWNVQFLALSNISAFLPAMFENSLYFFSLSSANLLLLVCSK